MTDVRNDPAWRAARAEYVADLRPDEAVSDALVRRIDAAVEMRRVEAGLRPCKGCDKPVVPPDRWCSDSCFRATEGQPEPVGEAS